MFDFGHTIMDELKGGDTPFASRPVFLMPGLPEILPHIALRMGIWANTKVTGAHDVRLWLSKPKSLTISSGLSLSWMQEPESQIAGSSRTL